MYGRFGEEIIEPAIAAAMQPYVDQKAPTAHPQGMLNAPQLSVKNVTKTDNSLLRVVQGFNSEISEFAPIAEGRRRGDYQYVCVLNFGNEQFSPLNTRPNFI